MVDTFYNDAWADDQDVPKDVIREGYRDYLPIFVTVSELQALETKGHRCAIIDGVLYKLDADDETTADDGAACIVSADGGRYKRQASHVADDAVTDAKLRDSAGLSVIGRASNSEGDPADIAAATDGHVLRRSGTAIGFGTVVEAGIADGAVAVEKLKSGLLDTDGTLAANSATRIPAQSAVVTYVAAKLAELVDSSPAALDTLNELAAALGNDPNFATTMTNALAAKAAGPSSSTDNTLPRFDGTTGKTLQGSGITVDDSNNVTGVVDFLSDTLRCTRAYNVSSTDLDNLVTAGFYDGSAMTNAPGGSSDWWYILVQRHRNSDQYVSQMAWYLSASSTLNIYGRKRQGGNWTSWTKVLESADIGSTVQAYNAGTLTATLFYVIDGGGSAITTGVKGDLRIPFGCTITAAEALADQSGSIVVDIWKDTLANYPPTDADSITASAPVTLSSAAKSENTTLTGWTKSIAAGDCLRFNVDSASTVQRVTIMLKVTKS